jgi:hypothetical protein
MPHGNLPAMFSFRGFQFAAFTVFSIANLLYDIYSAAVHLIITCIVSPFPRYFGASLGASVPVFLSQNIQPFSQHSADFFPHYFLDLTHQIILKYVIYILYSTSYILCWNF